MVTALELNFAYAYSVSTMGAEICKRNGLDGTKHGMKDNLRCSYRANTAQWTASPFAVREQAQSAAKAGPMVRNRFATASFVPIPPRGVPCSLRNNNVRRHAKIKAGNYVLGGSCSVSFICLYRSERRSSMFVFSNSWICAARRSFIG